jgi:ectoine hydroxylase-related dioxygenase (phytanoyl-CoA dioxygenase family)
MTVLPAGTLRFFDTADDEFVRHYRTHGFALLADAIGAEDVASINDEALRLCRGDYGELVYGDPADGWSGSRHEFPAEADLSDEGVLRRYICIHHPHKVSRAMRAALAAPRVVEALVRVVGPNIKAMQSMLFIKSEGRPGQPWHQDEYFIPTRDRSLTAVWIALDNATVENGCLWVLPGSHRRGVLYPSREQHDSRFDCSIEAYNFPYADEDAVPVEIPAGSALIFNGYLLHRSLENSGRHGYRRALANHYMSAESLLPWRAPKEGEWMAMADYRDVVLVAGQDPYAYKGTVDLSVTHTRPDRDGGCER